VGVYAWEEDEGGWVRYLNSSSVQAHLEATAVQFIARANNIYLARQQGEAEPPTFYQDSWNIAKGHRVDPTFHKVTAIIRTRLVGNSDPTATWVEFGSHAGGDWQTPVLGYRILGRTMDSMEE